MTDEASEVEAKFVVDVADRLRLTNMQSVGGFSVVSRQSLDQDDLYFDSTHAGLAAAGSTLRVRRNQKGVFMTFKGQRAEVVASDESHVASRLEDEVQLESDYADRVDQNASLPGDETLSPLRRARDIIGPTELIPTVRLRNERLVINLLDDDGHHLELALDRCRATRLSDGRVVEFDEVELEAKQAERVVLLRLASALREYAPSLIPSNLTKLERALT